MTIETIGKNCKLTCTKDDIQTLIDGLENSVYFNERRYLRLKDSGNYPEAEAVQKSVHTLLDLIEEFKKHLDKLT